MGTSVRSSPSIVVREQRGTNYSKWLSLVLRKRKSTQLNLPSMSMTSREMERDAFYAGDLIRACNLNPTLRTIEEVGGQSEKGKKTLTKAEVFPMYKACKDSKDQGGFHDFVEILKLYDKNNDNTMIGNELFRLLTNLGEKLTKEEAKGLMKELCEPEDDDGFMPFIPFLEKMCA